VKRIVIFGNSGSGKTTMARALAGEHSLPHLDLDSLAWASQGVRRPVEDSARDIREFLASNEEWVVEGCYADLLELTLNDATELRFLNPGVEVCVAHCRARPWEPDKYATPEEQDRMFDFLLSWVREYETRIDEYSLGRHRALFDRFAGPKQEIVGRQAELGESGSVPQPAPVRTRITPSGQGPGAHP
jgi:adenylate kinase family enzyme